MDIFGNCLDVECEKDIFGNCIETETVEEPSNECNGTIDIFGNCIEDEIAPVEPVEETLVVEEPIEEPVEEPIEETVEEIPVVEEPIIEIPEVTIPIEEPEVHEDHFTNIISTETVDRSYKFESELMTFTEA
jgi:hypothetical protein